MNSHWYCRIDHANPHITRTDFHIARPYRHRIVRDDVLAHGLAEYFKTERLPRDEVDEWNTLVASGQSPDKTFIQRIKWALAEGVLKDDLETVDEDAFIGTCGQLLFKWIRTQYYGNEIIVALPKLLTDSSKKQGIDYFEILGDPNDLSSLYFIVWEIKATDSDIKSRTDEIYRMHRDRIPRLLRGLQMQLSLEHPTDQSPVLGVFVQQLMDHWQANTNCKRIGGAVIFDTTKNRNELEVFSTFHKRFPELNSAECRQVILIEVPKFEKTRRALWNYLRTQIF